jgi:hypothetical protein
MKYFISFLFAMAILATGFSQEQVIGRSMVLKTSGHPDSIPSLTAPAVNFGNAVALDTVSGNMYTFNYATEAWQKMVSESSAEARPYKVYTALLTQTGTAAPVATVLENTFAGTPSWSRFNTGGYLLTFTGSQLVDNKTTVYGIIAPAGDALTISAEYSSTTVMIIRSHNSFGGTSEMSTNFPSFFELRVYE